MTENQNSFNISVTGGVDWLSVTGKKAVMENVFELIKDFELVVEGGLDEIKALHGYNFAVALRGGRFQWGFKQPSSYWHLELSGSGCEQLGGDVWDLVMSLKGLGCNFRRIDLAFDFRNCAGFGFLENMGCDLENRRFRGFSSWNCVTSERGGKRAVTYYLGSRSSERFCRYYDKGLETGECELREDWVRGEFVFRRSQACLIGSLIDKSSDILGSLGGVTFSDYEFGEVVNRRVDGGRRRVFVYSGWFSKMLECFQGLNLRSLPRNPKNKTFDGWVEWLTSQVAPQLKALGDQCGLSPGEVLDSVLNDVNTVDVQPALAGGFERVVRERVEMQGVPF